MAVSALFPEELQLCQQHHLAQSALRVPAAPSAPQMLSACSGFLRASPINNVSSKDEAQGQDVMASNFETSALKVRLGEILQMNSRRVFLEKLTKRKFVT